MRFLLECEGKAAFVDMQCGDSSDYYGQVQHAFQKQAGREHDRFAYVSMTQMDRLNMSNGVGYTENLANRDGCHFEFIAMPDTTTAQIMAAKSDIRRNRDVVSWSVRRITEFINFTQPSRA